MFYDEKIIYLLIIGVAAIIFPICLVIYYKKKSKTSLLPCLVGALTFMMFAKSLENIPHFFFIIHKNPISTAINNSVFLYALYGTSMAGIFEETGRYIAFKYVIKNYKSRQTAISYGLGHGGFESIIVIGVTYLYLIKVKRMIDDGSINEEFEKYKNEEFTLNQIKKTVEIINQISLLNCILTIYERILAIIAHICLSILVFKSVLDKNKKYYLFAIVLHATMDIAPAIYQKEVISLLTTEIIILPIIFVFIFIAKNVYNSFKEKSE